MGGSVAKKKQDRRLPVLLPFTGERPSLPGGAKPFAYFFPLSWGTSTPSVPRATLPEKSVTEIVAV